MLRTIVWSTENLVARKRLTVISPSRISTQIRVHIVRAPYFVSTIPNATIICVFASHIKDAIFGIHDPLLHQCQRPSRIETAAELIFAADIKPICIHCLYVAKDKVLCPSNATLLTSSSTCLVTGHTLA